MRRLGTRVPHGKRYQTCPQRAVLCDVVHFRLNGIFMFTLRPALRLLAIPAVVAVAPPYVISTLAGSSPEAVSTPGNMTGLWQFSGRSSVFGLSFAVTGQIAQIGNNVSGQLSVGGTPCATSAAISGTVSNTGEVAMDLNESGQVVAFSGTLSADGNSASGTYRAPSGGCTNEDQGTWSGQRVSTASGMVLLAVSSQLRPATALRVLAVMADQRSALC